MDNYVSVGPHIKGNSDSNRAYLLMAISLAPVLLTGIIVFGFRSLLVVLICTLSSVASEIAYNYCKYKKFVFYDYSTILVGVLAGLVMPAGVPILAPVLGIVLSNILVKNCMGGRGSCLVSEVAFAKVLTFIAFAVVSESYLDAVSGSATSTTAVNTILNGGAKEINFFGLLFGNTTGAIGETAGLFLLAGGIALCVLKVIDYKIPAIYLGAVLLLSIIVFGFVNALYLMFSGGVILVAFYLLTENSCAPKTWLEKIIYSVGAGLITVLYWRFGKFPNLATFYAVLLMGVVSSAFSGYYRPKCSREKK